MALLTERNRQAEQSTAPDCLQHPLLRRSCFRQQVSASVGQTSRRTGSTLALTVGGDSCDFKASRYTDRNHGAKEVVS
jgi:hypothetical protein